MCRFNRVMKAPRPHLTPSRVRHAHRWYVRIVTLEALTLAKKWSLARAGYHNLVIVRIRQVANTSNFLPWQLARESGLLRQDVILYKGFGPLGSGHTRLRGTAPASEYSPIFHTLLNIALIRYPSLSGTLDKLFLLRCIARHTRHRHVFHNQGIEMWSRSNRGAIEALSHNHRR